VAEDLGRHVAVAAGLARQLELGLQVEAGAIKRLFQAYLSQKQSEFRDKHAGSENF